MSIEQTDHDNRRNNNEKLIQEEKKLKRAYESAIQKDLPFKETKQIYLRLKEIHQLLAASREAGTE
jgi:hypothetical protein